MELSTPLYHPLHHDTEPFLSSFTLLFPLPVRGASLLLEGHHQRCPNWLCGSSAGVSAGMCPHMTPLMSTSAHTPGKLPAACHLPSRLPHVPATFPCHVHFYVLPSLSHSDHHLPCHIHLPCHTCSYLPLSLPDSLISLPFLTHIHSHYCQPFPYCTGSHHSRCFT